MQGHSRGRLCDKGLSGRQGSMAGGRKQCEFFVVRYVPDAVKDEFVNIGVVLLRPAEAGEAAAGGDGRIAEVRFTQDWRRVRCLDPGVDIEMLEAIEGELRERLRAGGADQERIMHLLRDSFSNAVQVSGTKACLTDSPAEEVGRLERMYVETTRRAGRRDNAGRGAIVAKMRDAFEQAGVWSLMHKKIAMAKYTHKGDPLKLDCGYRPNGVVKFFHAVPLATDVDAAKVLAFSYPQIREGVARIERAKAELTAIVEDELAREDEEVAFAIETLEKSGIGVAAARELGPLAERARVELRV